MKHILLLDLSQIHSKHDILLWAKENFNFPEYFGMNWDALVDSLSELNKDDEYLIEIPGKMIPEMPEYVKKFIIMIEKTSIKIQFMGKIS